MKYRSEVINKEKKRTKFILIYSFIAVISIFIIFLIHTKNNINELAKEIPLLKTRLNNIQNSIISESKNVNHWKRLKSIEDRVEQIGMINSDKSNIIQVWWNKENN